MKVLLDIKDSKAPYLMEVLKGLSFVKAKVLEDIKEAMKEMTLIRQGKLKGRNAEDLINEL